MREREKIEWDPPLQSHLLCKISALTHNSIHNFTLRNLICFSLPLLSLSLFFLLGLWIVRDENVNLIWLGTQRLRISWLSKIWKPSGSLIQICVCKKNHFFIKVMILNSTTYNTLFRFGVLIIGISVCSVFTFCFEFVIADSSVWLQRKRNWAKERKKERIECFLFVFQLMIDPDRVKAFQKLKVRFAQLNGKLWMKYQRSIFRVIIMKTQYRFISFFSLMLSSDLFVCQHE